MIRSWQDQDGPRRIRDLPHALQMLFPTSSLRHKGVVLVLQLAQDSAPTAPELAEPLAPFFPLPGGFFGAGAGVGFFGAGSSLGG